ncbi:MAG: ErfK/YbiS/YcfS/YnhG family protein [Myxococcaceae bacterium]|nr:ErfK/YbiS/YcfS/YnhG family protein [Myxococcaceae bacterium]
MKRPLAAGVFVLLAISMSIALPRLRSDSAPSCEAAPEAHLLVDLDAHVLLCCAAGERAASYDVRLGSAGFGKRKQGDKRTPVGRYELGKPRKSTRYGMFIPIGYPTAAQKRDGLTGSGVGVHGPDRRLRWLRSWVNAFDTTDGCVGIATDEEMASLAAWVRAHSAKRIDLRTNTPR